MKDQLQLRVIVVDPPASVEFAVQCGRTGLLPPISTANHEITFQFPVTVADATSSPPRLTGQFVQGPPAQRFVYINSGTLACQPESCWTRRAKVPLTSITAGLLRCALNAPGHALEARISGRAGDGGPACATVPLLSGWTVVAAA